ncbi:MAG: cellulase family glycosylhydrolase [Thermoleophilia bacterium]|nr:cellulase family glycosylhydrolase [Thermoleophilia bacterium]
MRRGFAVLIAALACAIATSVALPASASAHNGVQFGIEQFGNLENPQYTDEFQRIMSDNGAKVERYIVRWDWVARGCNPATRGNAADMNNPCYSWGYLDEIVRKAQTHDLQMLFSIYGTPGWVFDSKENYVGTTDAQYAQFVAAYADFAQAVATRYDGRHGQPRVPQITIWNEPNGSFFQPRWVDGVTVGPTRYARLYDAAARRIKAVDPTLRVGVGPTAPHATALPPMTFAQGVLTELDRLGSPIDAWAHNAYTGSQSPFRNTVKPPYVSLGNIDDLTALMDRYSVAKGKPIWVTEFGYQTSGGQKAIEVSEQPDLLADALYFAWTHPRIDTFIWYQLHDDTYTSKYDFMSGLYYEIGKVCGGTLCPKPGAAMYQRTVWASPRNAKGLVTVWAQARVAPEKTRLFVQRPGDKWRAYVNSHTAKSGTVYSIMALPNGTKVMACDTACGPQRVVGGSAVSGGGGVSATSSKIKRLRLVRLDKRLTMRRGISFNVNCTNCVVRARLQARGAKSGFVAAKKRLVVVGTARISKSKSATRVRLRLTRAANREVARRRSVIMTLRMFVTYSNGRKQVYDRFVVLR